MPRRMMRLAPVLLPILLLTPLVARADDSFTATNPATGQTEFVWSAVPVGGSAEIYFAILQGTQWSSSEQVSSNSDPDRNPRLAFSSAGERHLAWWRDGSADTVYYAAKPASGGSWSSPAPVSTGSVDARNPDVAVFSGTVYVAYETVPSTGNRQVIVVQKAQDPDPWPSFQIATSSQTEQLTVLLHTESGHLWADWMDSGSHIGWSEYVSGSWSTAQYESYSGTGDLDPGRGRIRSHVLGQ